MSIVAAASRAGFDSPSANDSTSDTVLELSWSHSSEGLERACVLYFCIFMILAQKQKQRIEEISISIIMDSDIATF